MSVKVKATVAGALEGLPLAATAKWPLGVWDTEVIAHGSMTVSLFAPKVTDYQTPHDQDELYIIVAGSGEFICDGQTHDFAPSDVLFVPAGVAHRFTRFTPDFAAWVVFYGPPGGEAPAQV